MKTIVYVDGFNLYYGTLKKTRYKWLDLRALFQSVLKPHHQIVAIKYFTAKVSATADNPDVHTRQDAYLRALIAHDPTVQIILGHYLTNVVSMKLETPLQGRQFANVIKREEKGSDVNLAVHLLNDAWKGELQSAVVVSNDSDLAESLRLLKAKSKVIPIILCTPGEPTTRTTNAQLKKWANASRYVTPAMAANAQLPNPVTDGAQSIWKPQRW